VERRLFQPDGLTMPRDYLSLAVMFEAANDMESGRLLRVLDGEEKRKAPAVGTEAYGEKRQAAEETR